MTDQDLHHQEEDDYQEAPKRKSNWGWKFLLFCLITGPLAGAAFGYFILWKGSRYQDLAVLEQHEPILFTRVYDRKGQLIDIISAEKRIILDFTDIPQDFVNALTAVEDAEFFDHIGVSPFGILSAVKDKIRTGRMRGASTLTQQLVKNITKDNAPTYQRKLKEQFLAVQLETRFTKEEIFAMYVNEVPFGNNQFGIEAAARFYFGKSMAALTLPECATLAGIPQAPSRLNPLRNPNSCRLRRNIVLDRMASEGHINAEELKAAKRSPLEVVDRRAVREQPVAGHFVDKVRNYLFGKYGEDVVRTSGWDIYTTLDMDYQKIAEKAVQDSLKDTDKSLGYRRYDCPTVFTDKEEPDILNTWFHRSWRQPIQEGARLRGLVMDVDPQSITVRIKERTFTLTHDNMKWVARKLKDMNNYFKVGDTPVFTVVLKSEKPPEPVKPDDGEEEIEDPDAPTEEGETAQTPVKEEDNFPFTLHLDQNPDIQGSFMAVDNRTGDILAMVGGYDYRTSKFNRAEQAQRQVGSAFKPVVVGAALEQGYTVADILFDEPTLFLDPKKFELDEKGEVQIRASAARKRKMKLNLIPVPKPYRPHNYYNRYSGRITLRRALAMSKNIVSVKLINAVGYDHVLEYSYRLKLDDLGLQPYPSLALGSMEMSLSNLVYTYGIFANNGVRYEPRFISVIMDSKGRTIEKNDIKGEQVVSPQNAFLVTDVMRSVVEDEKGTAKKARKLKLPVAGKTGTTDDYTDAWFIGYTPQISAGAWVGRDLKQSIGKNRTGGGTALPIWMKFFQGIREDLNDDNFVMPEGLIKRPIDKYTGKKFTRDCDCDETGLVVDYFVKGTEPTEICTKEEQARQRLPWYLQKRAYSFDNQEGEVKPATVMIDYASQQRALKFLKDQAYRNVNN